MFYNIVRVRPDCATHKTMPWWIWIIVGFVLLAAELLTPGGFYLLLFGCGALAVGLLTALGWSDPLWFQGVLFCLFSVLSVLILRRPLVRKMQGQTEEDSGVDRLVGEIAYPEFTIAPEKFGKAEFRGTTWNARNVGEMSVGAKQRCKVEKVDGLTLWIQAE